MISFRGAHFAEHIILTCVRWHATYPLSDRQLGEKLREHAVSVAHATDNRWSLKYVRQLEGACHRTFAQGTA